MSVFVFLPVVFYKNVFVFLDLLVFCKNVLSYFKKLYVSVSTLKYAYKKPSSLRGVTQSQASPAKLGVSKSHKYYYSVYYL